MTRNTVLELAVCTVADRPAAEEARRAAMQAVRLYPAFAADMAAITGVTLMQHFDTQGTI